MNKKRIALAFPMGSSHWEKTAYGIRSYCNQERDKWKLITNPETHDLKISEINLDAIDGIIAVVRNKTDLDYLKKHSVPCVNISGTLQKSDLPRVCPDFYQMGQLAAQHFFERGFQNFAYFGLSETVFF